MKRELLAGKWAFESWPGVMISVWARLLSEAPSEKQLHYGIYWVALEQGNYKVLKAVTQIFENPSLRKLQG